MNNRIVEYRVTEIDYVQPNVLFDRIDRSFLPSILTGEGPDDISKSSIIGINPVKSVTTYDRDSLWNKLRELNDSTNFHKFPYPVHRIGAIGTLSYEALHTIEKVDKKTKDHFKFPLLTWTIYKTYYYFDNSCKKAWLIELKYNDEIPLQGEYYRDTGFSVTNLVPDFTPEEYRDNVDRVRENIIQGEVYEVNLTQGIKGEFIGSPYSLYKKLYKENSAPYSAYLEREEFTVVCNSPELFLKCDNRRVETRPIKGTAPRSKNIEDDDRFKSELYESIKNQAELFMIVDLMRNDLSKVCKVGSVIVKTKKRLEVYKNVHHLVSIIEGELVDKYDYIDLLKATFPGGSITGCPKVRCMELTEELEKSSRNLYTGSIFVMNRQFFNSNIVIRSCVIKDNKIVLNSGGAITIDSDPEDEYRESLIKLDSLFKAVNNGDNI